MQRFSREKCLRRLSAFTGLRRAFSLAELVVAIGVLALMLTLAGQVMSLTTQSTGQAKALTDINQQFRILEQTLREDLKYVQPGNSLILIQGNPVNAYWTQIGQEADGDGDPTNGYPHPRDLSREDLAGNMVQPRADILMIFSSRRGRSAVHPYPTSEVQQLVYGHAVLGEYVPATAGGGEPYEFEEGPVAFPGPANVVGPSVDPTVVSPVPAEQWHLARRSVLLMPGDSPPGVDPPWPPALDDPTILDGSTDVVANFVYADEILTPWDWVSQNLDWTTNPPRGFPWFWPAVFQDEFGRYAVPFERSLLDPTPPAPYAGRLGHHFMPNCASFKVEWALDSRGEFVGGRLDREKQVHWFDHGHLVDPSDPSKGSDPLRSLERAFDEADAANDDDRAQLLYDLLDDILAGRDETPPGGSHRDWRYRFSERFRDDPNYNGHDYTVGDRPNLAVFGVNRRTPSGVVPDEIFPGALRITVDLYDNAKRLERPARHVMVIPVGG